MATIVLSAVGAVIGGPTGMSIGALIGQQVDQRLFRPKGRSGPRLSDLQVQTSSYGTQIPRLYGRTRVAGTVIWAADLTETAQRSGGKGQPRLTTYSYAASFAVALSSRRVLSVARIWADGKLLRGANGDFKSAIGAFRLHDGSEGQAVDPLIAMDLGFDRASAHRGIAYAVFEALQLQDFGNRIPSLSFEVVADAMPITTGAVAADLLNGLPVTVGADELPPMIGYSAEGQSIGDAIAPLTQVGGHVWRETEDGVMLCSHENSGWVIDPARRLARVNGESVSRMEQKRPDPRALPDRLALRYADADRDYLTGLQRADRPPISGVTRTVDLPAALSAGPVAKLARTVLERDRDAAHQIQIVLGWEALRLKPGDVVTLSETTPGQQWMVRSVRWERMAVLVTLTRWSAIEAVLPPVTDAGRALLAADRPMSATTLTLVELPSVDGGAAAAPMVVVAAGGRGGTWRPASIALRRPDGAVGDSIGMVPGPSIIGALESPLAPAPTSLFDRRNHVLVRLSDPAQDLQSATEADLVGGANAAMIGTEMIQFAQVEPLSPGLYRLSTLLRGRRGTDVAYPDHPVGSRFVLLDRERLLPVPAETLAVGAPVAVVTQGLGDASPIDASQRVVGAAIRPLPPVHLSRRDEADGSIEVRWIRKSRAGWIWPDGVDVPIGEAREVYRISLWRDGLLLRTAEVTTTQWTYMPEQQAADGYPLLGAEWAVAVAQIGDHAVGATAQIAL